ncbi:DMT family transporter [Oceanobacillus sp. MO10714A]
MVNQISMMMGGLLVGSQSSVNASLGRRIGTIEGALISFLTGTGLLAILVLFFGQGNLYIRGMSGRGSSSSPEKRHVKMRHLGKV